MYTQVRLYENHQYITNTYILIITHINADTSKDSNLIPFLVSFYQLLFEVYQLSPAENSIHMYGVSNITVTVTIVVTLSLVNAILSAKCAASLSFESFNIFSIVLDSVSM